MCEFTVIIWATVTSQYVSVHISILNKAYHNKGIWSSGMTSLPHTNDPSEFVVP